MYKSHQVWHLSVKLRFVSIKHSYDHITNCCFDCKEPMIVAVIIN